MYTKSGTYKKYRNNFVLTEPILRKIAEIVLEYSVQKKESLKPIRFVVYRSNDTFYETGDIEELLSEDNSNSNKISRLVVKIEGKTTKDENTLQIDFDTRGEIGVSISILDDDKNWTVLLFDALDIQIQRVVKKSFSRIINKRFFSVSTTVIFAIFFVLIFFRTQSKLISIEEFKQHAIDEKLNIIYLERISSSEDIAPIMVFPVLLLVPLLLSELGVLKKTNNWLRESVFYWGDEISRVNNKQNLQKNLFWVVIVGSVVSVILALIFR